MIDPDSLTVWHENHLVGYLWRDKFGHIGFRYDADWVAEANFTVSLTLPLTKEDYPAEAGVAHRFFANLLPEGGVRDHIVRDLKISNTDFDLLRAIGGECAGALSILPVENEPSETHEYSEFTEDNLSDLITRCGQIYASRPADDRPRLSLAGAQNKCPILLRDGHYFLPKGEAPSSHILKFEITDYRHLPAYETFTTYLAREIGLPTVDIELCSIRGQNYALVKRYDRVWGYDNKVQRLHQEDFCQALGYGHNQKYQEHGGPSFARCYQLVQSESTDPTTDTQNLLRWIAFNYLAGNSDGHAKNISLVYSGNGAIQLAPFYDLICTRAIERIDVRLSFSIGGQRDPGRITPTNWRTLAEQCDVRSQFLLKVVVDTAESLLDKLDGVKATFEDRYGAYPALQRIEQVVKQQCQCVLKA